MNVRTTTIEIRDGIKTLYGTRHEKLCEISELYSNRVELYNSAAWYRISVVHFVADNSDVSIGLVRKILDTFEENNLRSVSIRTDWNNYMKDGIKA